MNDKKIKVNLISGFLGVGKTTLLQHLVSLKPIEEKWVFLINEFGQISIDHTAFEDADGLKISEVAGGCICCSASLPMQITLNRIIKEIKPNRIIIEPTGLGHPTNMIDMLRESSYEPHLRFMNMTTVVNPAHFSSAKHLESGTWHDQIDLADAIVINKSDVATENNLLVCRDFISKLYPQKTKIQETSFGKIDIDFLNIEAYQSLEAKGHHHHHDLENNVTVDFSKRLESEGFGSYACGWVFLENQDFNLNKIKELFESLKSIERIKGVFKTPLGWFLIQKSDGLVNWQSVAYRKDSRVEFISSYPQNWKNVETQLNSTTWQQTV